MELLLFLSQVLIISLSGVMAPGPVTAAAIAMGSRNRFAGALIAVGHGIIEFPLMILIVLGMDKILKSTATQVVIGLAGGTFLLVMAVQMLQSSLRKVESQTSKRAKSGPVTAGIVLSGGNPYFLLWWTTVGLALATTARSLGVWAFVLFAVLHWLCDLAWLCALSWASFKGSVLLGPIVQKIVLVICSVALLVFGAFFVYRATRLINVI